MGRVSSATADRARWLETICGAGHQTVDCVLDRLATPPACARATAALLRSPQRRTGEQPVHEPDAMREE